MQNYFESIQQIRKRLNWTYLILIPYLVIGLVPWLKYRFPFRILLPLPFLWLVLNFTSIRAKYLSKREEVLFYKWVICLGAVSLLNLLFGLFHGNLYVLTTADMVDVFFNFLVFCILHVAVNTGHIRELRLIVLTCLGSLALAALTSIRGFEDIEGGARLLTAASSENIDIGDVAFAMYKGIGSYGTIYGLGLLIAPFILVWSALRLYMKIALAAMIALFLVASVKAAFTILVVTIGFGIILAVLMLFKIRGVIYHVIVGIGLFLIILSTSTPTAFKFLAPVLDSLSALTENPNYQFRIESTKDAIFGNTDPKNYASYRPALYWNSLDVFLTAPLTGYKGVSEPDDFKNIIGGHSFVFDALGNYGLLGGCVYIAFFIFYIKYIRELLLICGYQRFTGVLQTFGYTLLLVAFLNPIGGYQIYVDFLIILPGLFFFAEPRFPRRQVWMGGGQPLPSPN